MKKREIILKKLNGIIYVVDKLNNNIYDYIDIIEKVDNPKIVGVFTEK